MPVLCGARIPGGGDRRNGASAAPSAEGARREKVTIARFISDLWNGVERRRHPRLREPVMTLVVGGRKLKTVDWSLGGCLVVAAEVGPGPFRVGDRIEGKLRLPRVPQGDFIAEVVRQTDKGELGLRWLEVTGSTFLALSAVYS